MIRVDEDFMTEVGLADMPTAEKQAFMDHAEEELEVRVGQKISANLSDAQIDEFSRINDSGDATLSWLEKNVPNFRDIVMQVFQTFKQELAAERQSILG